MSNIVLTTKKEIKGGEKLMKNNKGFSLVELLIVIAIMGVLAVIAFNMFGGVLTSSKKRADDQQANNIAKAVLSYCLESGDWKLDQAKTDAGGAVNLAGMVPQTLIKTLVTPVYVNGREYGPYFTLKDPSKDDTDPINESVYKPQWPDYKGWKIHVYPKAQTVTCEPTKDAEIAIDVSTTK